MKNAVFVTDGEERATLAVVRALGRAGIDVVAGSDRPESLAGSSRYCRRQAVYPSAANEECRFQEFLAHEMKRGEYRVLIPMTDISMWAAAGARDILEACVKLPIPAREQIRRAQDKREVLIVAQRLGIACPATYTPSDLDQAVAAARGLQYPVVIKPRYSRFQRNGKWLSGPVEYAYNEQDLRSKYVASAARIPCPLIQEKLEGEGCGMFLLVWDGELKAAFCHHRLREKPPWGGVSVYRESSPLNRDLLAKSLALLRAFDWNGVAMVEFKLDSRDGVPKLMEVNGRFWGSLQLAIDAGINFPHLLYRLACDENVSPQLDYKVGVKSRWLLGDLDHLLIRLKQSDTLRIQQNGHSVKRISKLKACLEFMKLYQPNMRYEVLRWEDPAPGWFELKTYVQQAVHRSRDDKAPEHAR